MVHWLTQNFALVLITISGIGYLFPPVVIWFDGPFITYGLGLIMLSMGLTLEVADFKKAVTSGRKVILGLGLQYSLMPLLAYAIVQVFSLDGAAAAGLILVACCPGGTASNVITYLAKANVALSVTLTTFSTLMAAVMTPFLTASLLQSIVEVSVVGLFLGTCKVVLFPVLLGLLVRWRFSVLANRVSNWSPLVAVFIISMIVASIIANGKSSLQSADKSLFLAVFLLHVLGFLSAGIIGYFAAWDKPDARALSIEVGMQNSGLAVVLAKANFTDPFTAIPGAVSSLVHSLIGSLAAWRWRRSPQ